MISGTSAMIGSQDPKRLASFYEEVLEKKADWSQEDWFGFKVGENFITIGPHSEVKESALEPQRIFLNYYTSEVEKDFERIKGIEGAKVVKEPSSPDQSKMLLATFSDPDGNFFQLATPWEEK